MACKPPPSAAHCSLRGDSRGVAKMHLASAFLDFDDESKILFIISVKIIIKVMHIDILVYFMRH